MSRRQDDDWDEPDYVKVHNKMMKDHYGGNLNAPTASNNIDTELKEQILVEFKQVHRLAPADYTENCTNVVMRLIAADRNKLIKHLAFQLGEDEEHLRALAENIGSAPPAL